MTVIPNHIILPSGKSGYSIYIPLNRIRGAAMDGEKFKVSARVFQRVAKILSHLRFGQLALTRLLDSFEVIQKIIRSIPLISSIASIISCVAHIAIASFFSHKSKPTRSMIILTNLGLIGLGIASLILITLSAASSIVSAAIDVFQDGWYLVEKLKSRTSGKWQRLMAEITLRENQLSTLLTDKNNFRFLNRYHAVQHEVRRADLIKSIVNNKSISKQNRNKMLYTLALDNYIINKTNKHRKKNGKFVTLIHDCVFALVSFVTVVLMFTPMAPIATAVLIGISIYGILDKLSVNPFKWLAGKIFGNPFSPIEVPKPQSLHRKRSSTSKCAQIFGICLDKTTKPTQVATAVPKPIQRRAYYRQLVCSREEVTHSKSASQKNLSLRS